MLADKVGRAAIGLGTVLLAASVAVFGQAPQPSDVSTETLKSKPPAAQSSAMRAFIQVGDLERSLAFYRDLLGFQVLLIAEYDNQRLRQFVDMDDEVVPTVAILSADGKALTFSLLHVPGVDVDASANRRHAPTLIVDRSDILGLHSRAIAAGHSVVFAPQESRDQAQKLVARELGLVDPDGNRLLILEKF